jgi:hypothetical protein
MISLNIVLTLNKFIYTRVRWFRFKIKNTCLEGVGLKCQEFNYRRTIREKKDKSNYHESFCMHRISL